MFVLCPPLSDLAGRRSSCFVVPIYLQYFQWKWHLQSLSIFLENWISQESPNFSGSLNHLGLHGIVFYCLREAALVGASCLAVTSTRQPEECSVISKMPSIPSLINTSLRSGSGKSTSISSCTKPISQLDYSEQCRFTAHHFTKNLQKNFFSCLLLGTGRELFYAHEKSLTTHNLLNILLSRLMIEGK
jgi:hypothetical protein